MRKQIKYRGIGLAWIFLCVAQGTGTQLAAQTEDNNLPVRVVEEKIILTADRNLYIAGESIQFGAEYLTRRPLGDISWSTVLYVELVNAEGDPAGQWKFPLDEKGASGVVDIPKDLLTGAWFLKAYTKWMRNYPVVRYAYYPLKIINPFESVLAPSGETEAGTEPVVFNETETDPRIRLHTDKPAYKTKERVEVSLVQEQESDPDYYDFPSRVYSVSVVRKGTMAFSTSAEGWSSREEIRENTARYLPEINGICFSGHVTGPDGQPAEDANVSLCLLNNQTYFSKRTTNAQGEFFIRLPDAEKSHDFYIDAEKEGRSLPVHIDDDFCNQPVTFGVNELIISEEERLLAAELAVNAQLTERYADYVQPEEDNQADTMPLQFYGSPNRIVYTKDYINLPTVEEFVFEIIPQVRIDHEHGKPVIRSSSWNVYYNYPFLVMVDNIPIRDIDALLKLKTTKIEHFELIDNSYVIGDAKFSGILSLFSRNQDIAGLDLPGNSKFYQYKMFAESKKEAEIRTGDRLPDRRNCLFWDPHIELNNSQKYQFSFTTADTKGIYEIIVKRIDRRDGSVRWSKAEFVVE